MIFYAEAVPGDRSTMRRYSSLDGDQEARGCGGDELWYNPVWDRFSYALGSGISEERVVPNPVPGDPLAGALLVADMADADWASA